MFLIRFNVTGAQGHASLVLRLAEILHPRRETLLVAETTVGYFQSCIPLREINLHTQFTKHVFYDYSTNTKKFGEHLIYKNSANLILTFLRVIILTKIGIEQNRNI